MKPISLNNRINTLLKPKFLAPAIFTGLGGYVTYKDYKKAKPENKSYALTKDFIILTTSAAGYFAGTAIIKRVPNIPFVDKFAHFLGEKLSRIANTKFIKEKITPHLSKYLKPLEKAPKFMHKSLNHIERAIKDCLAATVITLGSIISAMGGNILVSKYIFKKHVQEMKNKTDKEKKDMDSQKVLEHSEEKTNKTTKTQQEKGLICEVIEEIEESKNQSYFQYMNNELIKDPANKVFATFSFLPALRALEFPLTAYQGYDISHEKGITEKIKKTSYSLIANTFVPTFFISIATAITREMKNTVRIPAIAGTTLLGIGAGTIAGKYIENKVLKEMHFKKHKQV